MVTRALQSLICVCVLAVASGRASAQVQISPNITFEVRTGTNAAPSGDPLLNLMLSQPPIDTSELFVHAEFDPPTVAMGQRTTLRVIVTALQDSVAFPDPLPAPVSLSVTRGGSAQQFQAMTGRMQVRSTFNFTVRPNASGSVGLPAFDITVAGRSVRVPGAKLNVLPSREPVPAVELLFDKMPDEVYVGQTVTARLVLPDPGDGSVAAMTQARVSGESLLLDGSYGRLTRHIFQRGGRAMSSFATDLQFTPMRPGPLTLIGQASVILGRTVPGQYARLPGYYPLFDTEPAQLTVRRVPDEGRLPGYTGAIGRLAADPPEISSNAVRPGEPVRLRVIVRGEANFRRFTAPQPAPSADWRTYPAEIELGATSQADRPGFIVFNYVFVPQSTRARATPAIPFAYFDPLSKRYVDAGIAPVPVSVTGPDIAQRNAAADGTSSAGRDIDEDDEPEPELAGLMTADSGATNRLEPLQQRVALWWFQLVPAMGFAGLWYWDRRRRHLRAHPWIVVRRRAVRAARAALKRADAARRRGDEREYVEAVTLALREAAAPLMNAEAAALVGRDVQGEWSHLPEHDQADAALAEAAIGRQFAALDRTRYSGSAALGAVQPSLEAREAEAAARELIGRLSR